MLNLDKAKNRIINSLTKNNELLPIVKDLLSSTHDAETLADFFKLDDKEYYPVTDKRLIAIDALALIGWYTSRISDHQLVSEFDNEKAKEKSKSFLNKATSLGFRDSEAESLFEYFQ